MLKLYICVKLLFIYAKLLLSPLVSGSMSICVPLLSKYIY